FAKVCSSRALCPDPPSVAFEQLHSPPLLCARLAIRLKFFQVSPLVPWSEGLTSVPLFGGVTVWRAVHRAPFEFQRPLLPAIGVVSEDPQNLLSVYRERPRARSSVV